MKELSEHMYCCLYMH